MFNICYQCGLYRPDKIIDPARPVAICPECGYRHPFRRLPLMIVSGPSGAGKSTVCQRLTGNVPGAVLLDSDILWRSDFARPRSSNDAGFFDTWLRMIKNLAQSGQQVVLFGAGFGMPEPIEACVERRYLGTIHYLALVCSDEVLADRLQQRPTWRQTHTPEYVAGQQSFNRWLKERDPKLQPPIALIDTTHLSIEDTTMQVSEWIAGCQKAG